MHSGLCSFPCLSLFSNVIYRWKVFEASWLNNLQSPRMLVPNLAVHKGKPTVELCRLAAVVCWLVLLWATIKIYCPVWTASKASHWLVRSAPVSFTEHGVLRGPICDTDSWLWSVLPLLDHVVSDLCRAMEVTATRRLTHDDNRFFCVWKQNVQLHVEGRGNWSGAFLFFSLVVV